MTILDIAAADAGTCWRLVARSVLAAGGDAFHVTVRIGEDSIDPAVLEEVDLLLDSQGLAPIVTVANTIFPASLASTSASPSHLTDRYRSLYERLRKHGPNRGGTYFGRIVAHPSGGRHSDQLCHVIEKLAATHTGNSWRSRYEVSIYDAQADAGHMMGFPCMSHCAFHLDPSAGQVHLFAYYRNQYVVERALGNYVGLVGLRDYVARSSGYEPGELMVVAGHMQVDGSRTSLNSTLSSIDAKTGTC